MANEDVHPGEYTHTYPIYLFIIDIVHEVQKLSE